MKVFGPLEYAQIHNLGSLPTPGKRGLLVFLTTDLRAYVDNGVAFKALLANDDKLVIGTSGTAASNVRLNRAAAGLLQVLPGNDATVEGTLSTTLAQVSARVENGLFSALPAVGNFGRLIFTTDTKQFLFDNGTSWVSVGGTSGSIEYNVIIGSAAQVASGAATHSSFASYTPTAGDRILLLPTYVGTENVTLNVANLFMRGQGNLSIVTGTFTLGASATKCAIRDFKITGVTTLTGADNFLTGLFLADKSTVNGNSNTMTGIIFESGKTWTDNSTGSYLEGVQL